VFVGLLTVTNEKGEIRICDLVATKAHSQFILALQKMKESLTRYGHQQPALFYTDNMSDKAFLERVFPSLRDGVIPAEKYGHLDTFSLPDDVETSVHYTMESMDNAVRTIYHIKPVDAEMTIGFDIEWNVEIGAGGSVRSNGPTAIVQIAYGMKVYIFQVSTNYTS
jgi:hypothetical protein